MLVNLALQAVPIEFDIYLSYCEEDTGVVSAIQDSLKAVKSDVRIYGNKQQINSEAVWQQDMYQVMIRSARVVTGKCHLKMKFYQSHIKFLSKILGLSNLAKNMLKSSFFFFFFCLTECLTLKIGAIHPCLFYIVVPPPGILGTFRIVVRGSSNEFCFFLLMMLYGRKACLRIVWLSQVYATRSHKIMCTKLLFGEKMLG